MSDELTHLGFSLIGSAAILIVAILICVRGPVGLVRGVDWARVSNIQGLGRFVSLIMSIMGALLAAHGALVYAFHDDRTSRNFGSVVFIVLMAILMLALLVGQQRFHDKSNGLGADKHGRR